VSALGSAVGAVTGAFQGLTGLGRTAASAAPIVEGGAAIGADAATSAAWGSGAGLGADTVAAVGGAAEGGAMAGGLAEGVGGLVGPSAELAGGFVGAPADLAGGGFQLMPTASNSALANAASGGTFAPQSLSGLTGSPGALNLPASATQGAAGASNSWVSSIWDAIKPTTPDGYRMYGNLLMGVGQGIMQGRAAQDEREWRQRMSAVPDVTQSFQAKPDFRWALMGGK
jgi:hypothetical protein